jgi:hypothetical protein
MQTQQATPMPAHMAEWPTCPHCGDPVQPKQAAENTEDGGAHWLCTAYAERGMPTPPAIQCKVCWGAKVILPVGFVAYNPSGRTFEKFRCQHCNAR